MPIQYYGALTGNISALMDSAAADKKDPHGKPHYMVEVNVNGALYRAAVNVLSDQNPPNLQFLCVDNYTHAILASIKGFTPGLFTLKSKAGTGALDYVQEDLFDFDDMTIVDGGTLDSTLNDRFGRAQTENATVYFLGSCYMDTSADEYFGFKPANGIHNIHMNQGSTGSFAKENGPYQDGGVFIHYPSDDSWTAMFFKFQSQQVGS
ncbi:MAG TPA: DUF2278 family protein [Dinghuibacter sp.]|uniref:DUF2278 family protein n=1 Tax=Dinghuibacter sp. TaxID=2024697 RepID=UPI002C0571C7|nr:DUF2278 family protein [Dinghuibacter sp.]HTJ14191.1 DUF2278 family protein [Dinghuibacter sp.]